MKTYAFGVDVGGTTVKLGLFATTGELLEKREFSTRTEEGGVHILEDVAAAVDAVLASRKIEKTDVEGVGAGVPGPVSANGTVFRCVNLGWGVFNVEQRLLELTGLRARAGNDANVAALGEMWQGGGKGRRNLVMVTLGTGIGGGVILDGRILPGVNGAAGEIGHIPVYEDDDEVCGCGKRGCLEQYASANGIVRLARRYLEAHPDLPSTLREMDRYTSKEIFEEAGRGDAAAQAVVEEFGKLLGRGLAGVAAVADPEVFVIGGGMAKAGVPLLEVLRKYYRHFAFHAQRETEFCLAELGNDAGIYGGVRMLLE